MPADPKRQKEKGTRDETGTRVLKYENYEEGKDYIPVTGNELDAIYNMARYNMLRARARQSKRGNDNRKRTYETK